MIKIIGNIKRANKRGKTANRRKKSMKFFEKSGTSWRLSLKIWDSLGRGGGEGCGDRRKQLFFYCGSDLTRRM